MDWFKSKPSETDKTQDEWLKTSWKNQQTLVKNGDIYWGWIQHLDKANKRQDQLDRSIITTIEGLKTNSYPDLAKQIQELQKSVEALQQALTQSKTQEP